MLSNAHLNRTRANSFNTVAEDYEKNRPGYPESLGKFLQNEAQLETGAKLLEIGIGPGQATRLFLGKGFEIVGVEPRKQLCATALKIFGNPEDLKIESSRFEEWDAKKRKFDLIYSGSAFHWVDPEIGFPKAANLLKPKGRLALFWNMFPDTDEDIWKKLGQVYKKIAPEKAKERKKKNLSDMTSKRHKQIADTGLFKEIRIEHFNWQKEYSTDSYIKLLSTFSDHIILEHSIKNQLFSEISKIIEQNGGSIVRPYDTVVFLMSI